LLVFFINIGKEAYFFTSQPQNLGQLRWAKAHPTKRETGFLPPQE
jgi:hypothetical protein